MDNFRINENGEIIDMSDLGADLYSCEICSVKSVLMFNWCYRCREKYPEDFEKKMPNFIINKYDQTL